MSSPHTRWIDSKTWICTRHLPSVRMDASIGMCAFSTCDSVRPRRESFDRVVTAVAVNTPVSKHGTAPVQQKKSVAKKTTASKSNVTASSDVVVEKCAWFKCTKGPNGERADSRPRSKYCSRACSNSSARHRHKIRVKSKNEE